MVNTVLYKIGGSLLDWPELAARVESLISRRPRHRPLLIVGGGPTADLVRRWDRIHRLGEERAHWLALESLKLNERLLAGLLPQAALVASRDDAERAWQRDGWPILCAHDFLQAEEDALIRAPVCERRLNVTRYSSRSSQRSAKAQGALPHTWDVTSDSIAAWVCLRWPADCLVLVKSIPPPAALRQAGATAGRRSGSNAKAEAPRSRQQPRCCEATGLPAETVDHHFGQLAPHLPRLEWVNLRAAAPQTEACRKIVRPGT